MIYYKIRGTRKGFTMNKEVTITCNGIEKKYPNVVEEIGSNAVDLLYYFLNEGVIEGQQGCESFDIIEYIEKNPELQEMYGADLTKYFQHYLYQSEECM